MTARTDVQPSAAQAEGAPPVVTVRVRVKSRTGESYFRGSRVWPANAWARVEVSQDELALLSADKWLDVIPLDDDAPLDAKDLTVEEQLGRARREIVALRAEVASLKEEVALEAATRPTAGRPGR